LLLAFRQSLENDASLEVLRSVLDKAFLDFEHTGLLENLEHESGQGSLREIQVYVRGNRESTQRVDVSRVRIAEIADKLRRQLQEELDRARHLYVDPEMIGERLFNWLRPRLPTTLRFDAEGTRRAADLAAEQVPKKTRRYEVGDLLQRSVLDAQRRNTLGGGAPLDHADMRLLIAEHQALLAQSTWPQRLLRSVVFVAFVMAALGLLSAYLWQRHRKLIQDWRRYAALVGAFAGTYGLAWLVAEYPEARLEIIPLVLCAMTIAIAAHVELAVFLGALVAMTFTLAHGYPYSEFIVLATGVSTSALFCRSIRRREKSVYIGIITGLVVFPVVIGVQLLVGYPFRSELVMEALWFAGSACGAGLLMAPLLPFLEKWFELPTDISLLELSDPNHALLKQLIQRAPGTYNHSINVASIAEAAADAIGGNGLLCRVGAYFHDIGKMRKPEYFVENQGGGANKHDDLVPTMSTLVIISHVKDGVDMARSHYLPQRIIDLIEQHHGTTVVEYFYRRAVNSAGEEDVSDADFRYPGPKPQTPEAAVLMLADAIEGACRTLREPAPSRIEAVVRDITKKRLDDGQFDECPITIQQISMIQESLTKSLNAMYHARVKYSEQQFA
ncbi:MAG TPA: HDIG domain-containing protein, partial [Pirellulaceae bacterium]|nr:HDIG domain-containing protein [Pirellulaceae bacterium]